MLSDLRDLRKSLDWVTLHLPGIYVVVALLVSTAYCVLTPPFDVPDESYHARRELQLAQGHVLAEKTDAGVGGAVDANFLALAERMDAIREAFAKEHGGEKRLPDGRVTQAQMLPLEAVGWAHRRVFARFPNTAVYPPWLYLPQAAGWRMGEAAGMTIIHALMLARLCAACCAIVLGWLALRSMGDGRWPMFAYLLLPTELSLMGSCSQDALQFSIAGLVVALLWRAIGERRELKAVEVAGVACLVSLCVMARAPYLPLALVILLPALEVEGTGWRKFLLPGAGIAAVIVATGCWQAVVHSLGTLTSETARPAVQVALLKAHPLHGLRSLLDALFVAEPMLFRRGLYLFGTNDAAPPRAIHGMLLLGLAGVVGLNLRAGLRSWAGRGVALVALLGVMAGMWFAEYLIWTAPGAVRAEGLQVRYFLPLVPFALLLCPARLADGARRRMAGSENFWLGVRMVSAGVFVVAVLFAPWIAARAFYGADLGRAFVLAVQ